MDSKILEYHVSGYIERLRKTYFPSLSSCASTTPGAEDIELDLAKASGRIKPLPWPCTIIV